jgi:hypothetical protein
MSSCARCTPISQEALGHTLSSGLAALDFENVHIEATLVNAGPLRLLIISTPGTLDESLLNSFIAGS